MDVLATRGWGIAASGAMIVAALLVAFTAPERPRSLAVRQTEAASTTPQLAEAPRAMTPAPSELIVHFRGRGPLARAEQAQSARRVRAELSRQRGFRGLCFASFAANGVVLRACHGGALTGWTQRLHAMRAVASVERGD